MVGYEFDKNIPKEQKVAIFRQKGGPVAIETAPVTQQKDLKPNEALVQVVYSGVCHTDLHAMLGDWPLDNKLPLIGGHEGAGYVVAIGEHSDTSLKIGDKVGIKWIAHSCNRCSFCNQGFEPLCKQAQCSGFSVDGSFQQYAVSYTSQLSLIPDSLPLDDAAPILCAGVTVYKALKESGAKPGEHVVILGAGGGLGHLAIQYAAYMGFKVIAIDTGDDKEKLCKDLGAEIFLDFKKGSAVEAAQKATPDGHGPQAVICTSSGGSAYKDAMEMVRPHGTVVAVGLPPDAKIEADVFFTVFLSKRLVGSYVGNRQDAFESLAIAASGKVKCIYKTLPMSALPQVYDDMHKGKIAGRIVLDMTKAE